MEKSVVSRELSVHQEHELLLRLEKAGLTKDVAQRVIESQELAQKIVALTYEPTTSQKRAREIMDKNFLGVEKIIEHFGILLNQQESAKIAKIPFSESTLKECKDTHVLFLGIDHDKEGNPLTINRFREMFPANGQPNFRFYKEDGDVWHGEGPFDVEKTYIKEPFVTQETCELCWYLISKSTVYGIKRNTYAQQEELLKENEYRERAIVYIYGGFLMYQATGEWLFSNGSVRCKDIDNSGDALGLGRTHIVLWYYITPSVIIWSLPDIMEGAGLAPARKPELSQ